MFSAFLSSLPGAAAQGIIWGIMAIGVYITYKILDFADLTVDGSFATGGAVFAVCTIGGMNVYAALLIAFIAGCIAGLATGIFHTVFGIPPILAGILTQLALYSINLDIMGRSNQTISVDQYNLLFSLRYVKDHPVLNKSIIAGVIATIIT
ncbi:MAG: ABC transporter permease, partial [Eubacterium sp.]|nr:ABC transporter permease [Eubacterium sp.]